MDLINYVFHRIKTKRCFFAKVRAPSLCIRFFFFHMDDSFHGRKTNFEKGLWAYCCDRYNHGTRIRQIASSDIPSAEKDSL